MIYRVPAELHILRDLLMHKYGREFSAAVMENRDGCVPERVSRHSFSFFFQSPEHSSLVRTNFLFL